MRGIFRRTSKQATEQPLRIEADINALLPRSARQPEKGRFAPLTSELPDFSEEEDDDEDVQFLESLAQSVEQEVSLRPRPRRITPEQRPPEENPRRIAPHERPADETLRVFHAVPREHDTLDRTALNAYVPAVELDDLMEDLATTAAALRRKAA